MNFKSYINKILCIYSLNNKYEFILTQIQTFRQGKKYNSLKLIVYKYNNKGERKKYKTIECKSERDLLLKLKEMI